jgi:YbgC/YbaW family acyl-CoA thioester hydrolase
MDLPMRVRFSETDAAGIVYYPAFFTWFVLGTDAILRSCDGSIKAPDGRPRWMLPTVESGASFVSPLTYDDEITIRSWITEVRRSSFRAEHAIYRGDVLSATGFEVRVHVRHDGERISALAIPDDLRSTLNAYFVPPAP